MEALNSAMNSPRPPSRNGKRTLEYEEAESGSSAAKCTFISIESGARGGGMSRSPANPAHFAQSPPIMIQDSPCLSIFRTNSADSRDSHTTMDALSQDCSMNSGRHNSISTASTRSSFVSQYDEEYQYSHGATSPYFHCNYRSQSTTSELEDISESTMESLDDEEDQPGHVTVQQSRMTPTADLNRLNINSDGTNGSHDYQMTDSGENSPRQNYGRRFCRIQRSASSDQTDRFATGRGRSGSYDLIQNKVVNFDSIKRQHSELPSMQEEDDDSMSFDESTGSVTPAVVAAPVAAPAGALFVGPFAASSVGSNLFGQSAVRMSSFPGTFAFPTLDPALRPPHINCGENNVPPCNGFGLQRSLTFNGLGSEDMCISPPKASQSNSNLAFGYHTGTGFGSNAKQQQQSRGFGKGRNLSTSDAYSSSTSSTMPKGISSINGRRNAAVRSLSCNNAASSAGTPMSPRILSKSPSPLMKGKPTALDFSACEKATSNNNTPRELDNPPLVAGLTKSVDRDADANLNNFFDSRQVVVDNNHQRIAAGTYYSEQQNEEIGAIMDDKIAQSNGSPCPCSPSSPTSRASSASPVATMMGSMSHYERIVGATCKTVGFCGIDDLDNNGNNNAIESHRRAVAMMYVCTPEQTAKSKPYGVTYDWGTSEPYTGPALSTPREL